MGKSAKDTAFNVLDYLRQYCYGGTDGYGDRFEWAIALRPLADGYIAAANKALSAKAKNWIIGYIQFNRPLLNAGANGEIDVPHFSATMEAYVLAQYRPAIIVPHFCGWGGDLASAAQDLPVEVIDQQQVNISAEQHVCVDGNFNPSDVPSDADGYKIAQMVIAEIEKGNKHVISETVMSYYNSNEINRRAHHFINDFGIADSANATYEAIKEQIAIKMSAPVIWDTKGRLEGGAPSTPAHRQALFHAFAKYCSEHK